MVTPPLWCPERESNPHGRSQRFLRPSCQPVAASGLDGALAEIRTRTHLALDQAPLPVGLQERDGAWSRIRTDIVPGLSRHPLPVGIPRQVVDRVGLEPTSLGFQPGAIASSATCPEWWGRSVPPRVVPCEVGFTARPTSLVVYVPLSVVVLDPPVPDVVCDVDEIL